MWSKSGVLNPKGSNSNEPASLIGEQLSGADYLKKNTFARGLNEIQTKGGYNNTWVSAENYSALRKGWLSCSLTQLLVAKEAYVEPKDPMLVYFRIFLKNRLNDTMAGSVTE
jgi:hypothetical protein